MLAQIFSAAKICIISQQQQGVRHRFHRAAWNADEV